MTAKPPSASESWTRALQATAGIAEDQTVLLADLVCARKRDAPALLGDAEPMTYGALADRIAQVARWALAQALAPGDRVGLLLETGPDYLAIWLGLSQVGVITALINTQLAGPALAHCVGIARPKAMIVGAGHLAAYRGSLGDDHDGLWLHGAAVEGTRRFETAVAACETMPLAAHERPAVTLRDRALLIYTSGTTGLPKAANVSHFRLVMWSRWFAAAMDVAPDDRLYDCLPLYHSVGGVVAPGAMLAAGASVVLRSRFSATRFWEEIAAFDCTMFQYIGELCRYLLAQPEREAEHRHRLRLCCGNGLRGDVWEPFRSRFAIPRILEFYAATEASFSLFNLEGQPGAIGRIPGFMAHRSPVALVRFDMATETPVRSDAGFCLRCETGETGEALGRLAEGTSGLSTRFEGYTDRADSDRKVLRNVFAEGDAWFRTGDLMRKDAKGFYYFVDRVGDTYRWKGENVAASEVEAALCACPGVLEANVYGVAVPATDGRAGMAALVVDPGFDLAALRRHLVATLGGFARPLFLRLRPLMETTGTFKPKKQALKAEGYDPARVADPLFVDDPAQGGFVPLDAAMHARIQDGTIRF